MTYAIQGKPYVKAGHDFASYPIDIVRSETQQYVWYEQITVYGDETLRNLVVVLLNKHFEENKDE